jgi:hypothetical protein
MLATLARPPVSLVFVLVLDVLSAQCSKKLDSPESEDPLMLRARTLALLLVPLIFASLSQAVIIYDINEVGTYTLGSLTNNGSIAIDGYVFSDFSWSAGVENDGVAPGAGIAVTAVKVNTDLGELLGLRFNAGWTAGADQVAGTTIRYSVQPLNLIPLPSPTPGVGSAPEVGFGCENRQGPKGPFVDFWPGKAEPKKFMHLRDGWDDDDDFPPVAADSPVARRGLTDALLLMTAYGARSTGQASVTENIFAYVDGGIDTDALAELFAYKNGGTTQNSDYLPLGGLTDKIFVEAGVAVRGGSNIIGSASISEFYTLFNGGVLPEPTSMTLLAAGLLGVLRRRRR